MGYARASAANTYAQIDDATLARELAVRNRSCEVPSCIEPAVGMFKSGVPAWACSGHLSMHAHFRKPLEGAIVMYVREHVAHAARLAYEWSDQEEVISFGAWSTGVMIQVSDMLAPVDRYAGAPPASPLRSTLRPEIVTPVVRPPIATLGPENASVVLFDPFEL